MDGNGTQHTPGTTVLVVDDVAASRYAMGAVLTRAGHQVVPVASGGEALVELDVRLRDGTLPDVALVDVGLPDMSGFELCRRVRARPPMGALPVVHFSAAATAPGDRCRGLDAGGDAYLTVPAEPQEIQAVVRAAVRGARRSTGAETAVHRLTLLSEAIVTVQTARCPRELAAAAADGAARLTASPAVVFVIGPDGEPYRGTARCRPAPADSGTHQAAARLVTRLAEGRTGVHGTVVPAPLWPAGMFRPGVEEDARLTVATAQDGRTAVCLATPVRRTAITDPAADGLLARLAQACALAAEPLLLYRVERHVALTLQHSFLPQPHKLPHLPGVDIVVRYVPASRQTEIGGDFYAALRTGEGVLIAVGDVVGHSLDAATVMVEIRHALRAYCVTESDPVVLAEQLDRMLQQYHPDITATVCLALVDPGSGRVRISNAGHIPPLILREGGGAEYVDACGPLLGLGLERPAPTERHLEPTDRLLMVTDGLIETRGTPLETSLEQLRTAAADAPAGLDTLCDVLLGCFGRDREDDIAMLALRLGSV
ncbi:MULTISPECIES: fused response regulator/phosphatase [Streptomyces]|uniref:Alkaline phosphatase synthesis transcriptional regulatory protein PhoP n=1 Tax=Streptomyces chartreusis NRRL 3882 TaxID=1079985 RepID=A0A2N9BG70_STRCX|nr:MULTISPECIES: fused response regulator/phosphatase [Streptomyces]MYS89607.1 SpoIIE family protein phosphatase [Streptomyces sp. SID5464]SOR82323.1 Alkaline phosphatase synthesis transcriptional regulatory protein PhoP [Streptomyces chartreusis NRRL 3882]